MIMENSNYVENYSEIGFPIRHTCRQSGIVYRKFSRQPISRQFRFRRGMGDGPLSMFARKICIVAEVLLLSACAISPPPSTNLIHWPNLSLSNSPLSDASISSVSPSPEMGKDYSEKNLDLDMEQRYSGKNGISRIAKAYLDYTFFSRRTGHLRQDFQGRLGITHKTTDTDYQDMPKLRSKLIQDYSLSSLGSLQTDNLDTLSYSEAEYLGDNSFLASLEWRLNAPGFADKPVFDNLTWGDVLQISFFADYGKTFSNSMESTDAQEHEFGIGTGLRFLLPGRFTANFQAAYPLDSWERNSIMTNYEEASNTNRTQYWFDFSYNF
uniref:Uncharacterized protein n=1 Tax=Candidatus Kentrum sp. TC TaxID=2126339 RepID=A0A450ZCX7_9GAMM|nr:MAG: hypothetical protein BECKTC1821D_GA0114238_11365 [Candidatus Kentron sp. TC]